MIDSEGRQLLGMALPLRGVVRADREWLARQNPFSIPDWSTRFTQLIIGESCGHQLRIDSLFP